MTAATIPAAEVAQRLAGLITGLPIGADSLAPEQVSSAFFRVSFEAEKLAREYAERARLCAELLHKHLPEHFPDPAELVLMWHAGQWWVLVDITLRMLKPRELFRAQGFPRDYHFERVPDPSLLFRGGKQAADPRDVPLIDLSTTAQVRMCGNSVCPPLAEALARANFAHEALIYGVAA